MSDPKREAPREHDEIPPERDAPPDDADIMTTLASSHDSVTDFDTLLDTVPNESEEL